MGCQTINFKSFLFSNIKTFEIYGFSFLQEMHFSFVFQNILLFCLSCLILDLHRIDIFSSEQWRSNISLLHSASSLGFRLSQLHSLFCVSNTPAFYRALALSPVPSVTIQNKTLGETESTKKTQINDCH